MRTSVRTAVTLVDCSATPLATATTKTYAAILVTVSSRRIEKADFLRGRGDESVDDLIVNQQTNSRLSCSDAF
jgi:hypothetical protein